MIKDESYGRNRDKKALIFTARSMINGNLLNTARPVGKKMNTC